MPLTDDCHEDFVEESCIPELTLLLLQALGIVEPELPAPPANRLLRQGDSSLGEQILDISETDTEFVVEPDCMTDDFRRIPLSVITRSGRFHAKLLQVSGQVDRTRTTGQLDSYSVQPNLVSMATTAVSTRSIRLPKER